MPLSSKCNNCKHDCNSDTDHNEGGQMLRGLTSCALRSPISTLWHLLTATVYSTVLIADVDDYLEETLRMLRCVHHSIVTNE